MELRYTNRKLQLLAFAFCTGITFFACSETPRPASIEIINDAQAQSSIFNQLIALTNNSVTENEQYDSLAFLILPVEASCPSCRKKTIDSIMKHKDNLYAGRFIIISASGGQKTISSYFKEQDEELPVIENKLFLDSVNSAAKLKLIKDNPVIYYTANKKAIKKVSAIPATVRNDLHNFFSGSPSDL